MRPGTYGSAALLLIFCLLLSACPCLGDDGGLPADDHIYYDGAYYYYGEQADETGEPPVLLSLTHNCASTGVQLPAAFDRHGDAGGVVERGDHVDEADLAAAGAHGSDLLR